jgi:hypothetical protein
MPHRDASYTVEPDVRAHIDEALIEADHREAVLLSGDIHVALT